MSEMTDRVAKAIREVNETTAGLTFKELSEAMARAAIEALREPTAAMLEAGASGSGEDSEAVASGAWEFMIDAALT